MLIGPGEWEKTPWIEETDPATGYIPFRFTSKELDEETGLYYYGARYYEPTSSRWMSADPAGFELASPMGSDGKPRAGYSVIESLNWYSYVSNNPVRFVDPTGMSGQKETLRTPYFKDGTPYSHDRGLELLESTHYSPEIKGVHTLESANSNPLTDSILGKGRAKYTQKVSRLETVGRALPTGMGDSAADAGAGFLGNILDPDTSTSVVISAKHLGRGEKKTITSWALKVSLPGISEENRADGSNSLSFDLYIVKNKDKALDILSENFEAVEGILPKSGMLEYKNEE